MNHGKVDWKGCFVAAVTPFAQDGALDDKAFAKNLALLVDEGVHGIVPSGCTGESWALAPDERVRLFRIAVDAVGKRVPVVAGSPIHSRPGPRQTR